jgi:hypothetical protein
MLTVDHPINARLNIIPHYLVKIFSRRSEKLEIYLMSISPFQINAYTKNQDLIPSLGKKSGLNYIAQRIETYQLRINNFHVNAHMKNQDLVHFPSIRLAFSTYRMSKSKNQAGIFPINFAQIRRRCSPYSQSRPKTRLARSAGNSPIHARHNGSFFFASSSFRPNKIYGKSIHAKNPMARAGMRHLNGGHHGGV